MADFLGMMKQAAQLQSMMKALQDDTGARPRRPTLVTQGLGTQDVFTDSPHSADALRTPTDQQRVA